MTNPFWNPVEKRVRSLWRLIIQALFMFLVAGVISAVPVVALTLLSSQIPSNYFLMNVVTVIGMALAMLLSLWLAGLFLDRRPLLDFGLHFSRSWWLDFAFGLILGAVLMAIIFGVELAAGWVTITGYWQVDTPGLPFWATFSLILVQFICVGIYEELWSRGYHLRNLAEGFNFGGKMPRAALLIAYLISSSVFGLLHMGNPNASFISTFNIILAGLFLGLGFVLTGELAIPIGLHITWNFFQGAIFGFPVSGTPRTATLIGIQQGGPDLWTGGAFGPEAGLIGLLAIALGSLLIWLWVRWRRGTSALHTRLAVYVPKP